MTWPTGQEYNEVIQSPRSAFEDRELQSGRIETDRLGLPKPRSGNFAVVYKVECGTRNWAVKCFTREIPDLQQRYAAISAHLRTLDSPYMVAFDYLAHGIRVRSQWFPVLKMEWVSGDPLLRHIEGCLRDPSAIRHLAARWIELVKALRAAGIAHGDLQHGNLLVVGDNLKLVDYDGMFVPALAGLPATEVGHPNYQHPGRARQLFGPHLDNFSAWCIYVSLVALSIDPALWNRLKAGDDCLLFRAGDLAAPDRSPAFRTLLGSPDGALHPLVAVFAELLRLTVDQVPPLDEPRIPLAPLAPSPPSNSAHWLEDHVKPSPRGTSGPSPFPAAPAVEEIDASWILKPPAPPQDARFTHSVLLTRFLLWISAFPFLAIFALAPGSSPFLWFAAILFAANLPLIISAYRKEPGVASRKAALRRLSGIDDRLRAVTAQLTTLERKVEGRNGQRDREVAAVESQRRTVIDKASRDVDTVKRRLDKECAPTQRRRAQVDAEKQTALANVARTTGAREGELRTQLGALTQQEATEVATLLATLQSTHRRQVLSSASIAHAPIHGVGPKLRDAMILNGITSAYDVDQWKVYRIPGFGPTRVSAVMVWVNGVEQRARATMPQALSGYQAQAIRASYQGRTSTVSSELQRVQSQRQREEGVTNAKALAQRHELDRLEAGPRAAADRDILAIQHKCADTSSLLKKEQEQAIARAADDVTQVERKAAALRHSRLALHLDRSQGATRVKAYGSMTFRHYLTYIAFGPL